MRFLIITFIFCLSLQLFSCKSNQKITEQKTLLKVDSLENGSRKLYLLKNKKLEVLQGDGYLTYKIEDNEKTNVLMYVYAINQDQVAFDGGYKEEVLFEIPNETFEKNYSDKELQTTKMLFGRYCFCRGKNGIFRVMQGKLHVNSSGKEVHFELDFKVAEVPQETEKIRH